jgi:hypothetical protein
MVDLVIAPPANGTDSFLDLLHYVNTTTSIGGQGGIFGIGIILATFFGVFLLTKAFSFDRSFVTASFITAFIALFLRILNLINDIIFYIMIIIFVISIFFIISARSDEGVG